MSELDQHIDLVSCPADDIPDYLAANCRCRTCDGAVLRDTETRILLTQPARQRLYIEISQTICTCPEPSPLPVCDTRDEYKDKTLVICGAVPSLKQAHKQVRKADHVWGCNRAAVWLTDHGWKCTHGLAIDPGENMYKGVWKDPPAMDYLLATSVNPRLPDHLLEHGNSVRFFHSLRGGVPEELQLYKMLFPPTALCFTGLNAGTRALDLADFLGYKQIYMAGCDHALSEDGEMYVGGEKFKILDLTVEGVIDGRKYVTRPDMLSSAKALAYRKKELGSRMEFIGMTLPRALSTKSPEFLERVIRNDNLELITE